MTPELEALARRAVACPGWRWMPGMRDAVDGDRAISVATRGQALWVRWAVAGEAFRDHRWLPDFDDPATVGCLLALVREAWDWDVWAESTAESDAWIVMCPVLGEESDGRPLIGSVDFTADTEPGALVLALEAAPRREVAP